MKNIKNRLISPVLFIVLVANLCAMTTQPQSNNQSEQRAKYSKQMLIDNFDDADISAAPAWWRFDNLKYTFSESSSEKQGLYFLKISGKTSDFYVGGFGTYVGKDATGLDHVVLSVFGTGPQSGIIKIEIFDDDNSTYQLEQDNQYQPLYDDKIEYEFPVDWEGWRTVAIPIGRFLDVNPGVGDDLWNPDQENNSGGLLHFQIVINAVEKEGTIAIGLDNVKLVKYKK